MYNLKKPGAFLSHAQKRDYMLSVNPFLFYIITKPLLGEKKHYSGLLGDTGGKGNILATMTLYIAKSSPHDKPNPMREREDLSINVTY
jgi:hypothetical protein